MKLVIIESPFKGGTLGERFDNVAYARLCMQDSLRRGEAPFASHLLYPQILGEDREGPRLLGINCGLEWGQHADYVAFYTDRGWSPGMIAARDHWLAMDKPFYLRALNNGKVQPVPFPDLRPIEESRT